MNIHPPNPDDQNWDVFRYVAGEMSSGEETYFEQRLERDQQLREEVASMTAMMARVNKAHSAVKIAVPDRSRSTKLRIRRIIVSVAALILFATLAITLMPEVQPPDNDGDSIAIAWAESVDAEEFELPEQDDYTEFASVDFDSNDDWIVDAISADDQSLMN